MLTERTKKIIVAALIAVAVVGMAIGAAVLPDTLVVQIKLDGTVGNTMPKLLGLAIPAALIAFGAVQFYKNGVTGGVRHNGILICAAGLIAFALLFAFNLTRPI